MTMHNWIVTTVGGAQQGVRAHTERWARGLRLNDLLDAAKRRDLSLYDILDDLPASARHSEVCACRMGEGEAGASTSDLYPEG